MYKDQVLLASTEILRVVTPAVCVETTCSLEMSFNFNSFSPEHVKKDERRPQQISTFVKNLF